MTGKLLVLFLACVLAVPAAAAEDAEQAIRAQLDRFEAAFNAGKGEAVGAFYTQDAIAVPPGSPRVEGREAIGRLWPASYFLHLNVGAFAKGLGWPELLPDILALAAFGPAFTAIAVAATRKQER